MSKSRQDKIIIKNSIEEHIEKLIEDRVKVFNERDSFLRYSRGWRLLNAQIANNTKIISELRERMRTI